MRHMARPGVTTLVGRVAQSAVLRHAGARAAAGVTTVALVRGEAGIGKSRLVADWAASARAEGTVVALGRCIEVEGAALPLAPMAAVLRDLVRTLGVDALRSAVGAQWPTLALLAPELSPAPADGVPATHAQTFDAFAGLVRALAGQHPLALVVEDVHWSDPLTRDLLSYLARAVDGCSLLLVLTTRPEVPEAAAQFLAELVRLAAVDVVDLPRLEAPDVVDLVGQLRGEQPSPEVIEAIIRLSDGIPFLVEELADNETASVAGALLLRRWRRLGPAARQVVVAASLADAELTDALLRATVAEEVGTVGAAIREAVDGGVLVGAPERDGYRFRHALLREAVSASLLPGEARAWHEQWARALEAVPRGLDSLTHAVALAHHWDAAGDAARALTACLAATFQCRLHTAFVESSRWLMRAVVWWDGVPDAPERTGVDRDRLVEDVVDALTAAEARRDIIEFAQGELARTPGSDRLGRARWRVLLVDVNMDSGLVVPVPDLDQLVELVRSARPSRAQAWTAQSLAWVLGQDDPERAVEMIELAVASAKSLGDELFTLRLKADRAYEVSWLGAGDRALEEHHRLLPDIDRLGPSSYSFFLANMVALNHELGHLEASLAAVADVGRRLGNEVQAPLAWGQMSGYHAATLVDLGRWDEGERVFAAARARYDDAVWPWYPCWRALLHSWRGEVEAAERTAANIHWPDTYDDWDFDGWVRVTLAAARGDIGSVRLVVEPMASRRNIRAKTMTLRPLLAAAAAEANEAARALALGDAKALAASAAAVRTLREVLDRVPWPGPGPDAHRLHITAELDRWSGSSDPAPWQLAIDAYAPIGYPHERAWALLHLAEALVENDRRDEASSAVHEATEIAEHLGARPLADEVAAFAVRARLSAAPVPEQRTKQADPASSIGLTDREREVLALLCEGLTNPAIAKRLYMSPKTASVHVSRILAKLGATNRTAAATAAHRLGLDQPPG
jgi:DNA-binding CsgD family transcriptional regulator/tetratricopeptide (TPR) repeat protein